MHSGNGYAKYVTRFVTWGVGKMRGRGGAILRLVEEARVCGSGSDEEQQKVINALDKIMTTTAEQMGRLKQMMLDIERESSFTQE